MQKFWILVNLLPGLVIITCIFYLFCDWLDYFSVVCSLAPDTHTILNLCCCSSRSHYSYPWMKALFLSLTDHSQLLNSINCQLIALLYSAILWGIYGQYLWDIASQVSDLHNKAVYYNKKHHNLFVGERSCFQFVKKQQHQYLKHNKAEQHKTRHTYTVLQTGPIKRWLFWRNRFCDQCLIML